MESSKNKYPGFIDGLKASNIAINKTSLNEYSEQILARITLFYNKSDLPQFVKEQLLRSEEAIKNSINIESADEIIQYYIKFGDIFLFILPDLKLHFEIKDIKDIAINYLQIAKYSTDSRIKDIAIALAKDIE